MKFCSKRTQTNGWLGQIDPPLCLLLTTAAAVAVVAVVAVVVGLAGLAVTVQETMGVPNVTFLSNFFLGFPPCCLPC